MVWVYNFYISSERLADTTNNRIKAIQISREWIEAMTNIRNTNWLLYGADYENCWNTLDYRIECIADSPGAVYIEPGSYIIYNDTDLRWKLNPTATWSYNTPPYRQNYWVEIGADGFYNQSITWYPDPEFTREIIISYPEDTNGDTFSNSDDEKMLVRSFVQWWRADTHKVELSIMLSNWKNKD